MKIVISTAVYYPMINGVAVFSHQLAEGLARRGHEVLVLCPSQTGKPHQDITYFQVESKSSTEHNAASIASAKKGKVHTASQKSSRGSLNVNYLKSHQLKFYPDQIHPTDSQTKSKLFYRHGLWACFFPHDEVFHLLGEFQPDVIHAQVADPIGQAAAAYAKKNHIPLVATEHNQPEVFVEPLGLPSLIHRPVSSFLSSYFTRRLNHSDFATMPTKESIKNLILDHGKKINVPIAVVSNGVDLSNFRPGKPSPEIYQKYHLPKKDPIVLYVGRVDPEKKVDLLLDAFLKTRRILQNPTVSRKYASSRNSQVSNNRTVSQTSHTSNNHTVTQKTQTSTKYLDPHLVIVGDGVALPTLKKQAHGNQYVHFLGRITPPDLYQLYQTGTLFATMSEIETEGIVLIEAAATGLPLLAVNKGAVSAVCQDKQNGFLCPPGDTKKFAIAMAKILVHPELQQKFRQNSLKIAKEHDFERTLDQFENIYHKVKSKKRQS